MCGKGEGAGGACAEGPSVLCFDRALYCVQVFSIGFAVFGPSRN